VRHKSYSVAEWRIDEAISDMETLDYDYHLFTELGSNQDRVVDGGGPTGYRLAQVELHPEAWAPHAVEVTVSEQPAPALSTDEAIDRMAPSTCRSCSSSTGNEVVALVYHRYDGHYGLITPAERS
jgi:Sigma 54 modulation/S30EA ribosomal protein C terminus